MGIENVYPTREDRLQRILTQFYFREFREKEFFNSHNRFLEQSADLECTGTISLLTNLGIPVNESFVVLRTGALRLVDIDSYIVITRTMEKMRD